MSWALGQTRKNNATSFRVEGSKIRHFNICETFSENQIHSHSDGQHSSIVLIGQNGGKPKASLYQL